jgi:hypothetical protein
MSATKQAKKPVAPKRSKANPKTSKRAWVTNSGLVISNLLLYVAECASLLGVQHAAQAATLVFSTIENVQANKADFEIIANDAADLIIAIWHLQEKSETPNKWASPEIRDMVGNLKTALEKVNKIAERQAMRNTVVRVIFNISDAGQIRQTRQMIITAVSRFQVLSHIKMNELLLEVAAKQQELSQDMKNLGTPQEEEKEEEEEEEEEVEEFSQFPPNQAFVGPNSAIIHGFSFSNGSGHMINSNIGCIVDNDISDVGNNNSRNYYYG